VVKRYTIQWTSQAEKDISAIYEYIKEERQEPLSAEKVREAIVEKVEQLSQFPSSGSEEAVLSHLEKDYHSIVVKSSYKILYRVVEQKGEVLILGIIDARQSPEYLRGKV
jgi:addiction module RelE/StbE family toxin